jgi:hypothetical protein
MIRSRLRNAKISAVHLVDKGDNPGARVTLFKRADSSTEHAEVNTPEQAYEAIQKIADTYSLSYTEALRSPSGQRIYQHTQQLYGVPEPEPISKQEESTAHLPDYLLQAAENISLEEGISVERAYGRIRKRYPHLAERYEAETAT